MIGLEYHSHKKSHQSSWASVAQLGKLLMCYFCVHSTWVQIPVPHLLKYLAFCIKYSPLQSKSIFFFHRKWAKHCMTSSVLKPITVCLNFYPIIYVQHALCHKFFNFFSSFVIFCLDACIVGLMKNCTIHAFQENGVILPVLVQCLMYTSVQFVSFTQVRVD